MIDNRGLWLSGEQSHRRYNLYKTHHLKLRNDPGKLLAARKFVLNSATHWQVLPGAESTNLSVTQSLEMSWQMKAVYMIDLIRG